MADTNVKAPVPEGKGFAARLLESEDAETIRLLEIAKSVGGVSSRKIVELGVKAYLQTADFKKKAEIIKKMGI
jgi:hypothetical protein